MQDAATAAIAQQVDLYVPAFRAEFQGIVDNVRDGLLEAFAGGMDGFNDFDVGFHVQVLFLVASKQVIERFVEGNVQVDVLAESIQLALVDVGQCNHIFDQAV